MADMMDMKYFLCNLYKNNKTTKKYEKNSGQKRKIWLR